jgi:hypothetical protein
MIVVRYTWHIGAHFQEALKAWMEVKPPESSLLRAYRAYQSRTGLEHTLALEWEFESLTKWEEFLPQFAALPANAEAFRRWDELVPNGATVEIWDLLGSG